MQYSIRHITQFSYATPIAQSIMEVRTCPRTDALQQCYAFELNLTPHAQLFSYQDFMGNIVHHFDIPSKHEELSLESRALVEVREPPPVPDALPPETWNEVDNLLSHGDYLEMTLPSAYARPTDMLEAVRHEFALVRRNDPLTLLRELNDSIYRSFDYDSRSTHVRSPIDDALRNRSGVCQDFAHIFISLVRGLGIPCRYVSGYLFHRDGDPTMASDRSAEDGSHAWAEAYLPELGWIGFDPTNNILAAERHVRVALGRDYADVPPTRGTYKGTRKSTLRVGVTVAEARFPAREELSPEMAQVTQDSDEEAEPQEQEQDQQ